MPFGTPWRVRVQNSCVPNDKVLFRAVLRLGLAVVVLGFVSWWMGLFVYTVLLRFAFHEIASSGDWNAIVYWSGFVYALYVVVILLPMTLHFAGDFDGRRRFTVLAFVGLAASLIPTIFVAALWGAISLLRKHYWSGRCLRRRA